MDGNSFLFHIFYKPCPIVNLAKKRISFADIYHVNRIKKMNKEIQPKKKMLATEKHSAFTIFDRIVVKKICENV